MSTTAFKTCPDCKQKNPASWRFCGNCGYDYRPAQAVAEGIKQVGRSGWGFTKTSFLLFIGVWVLIGLMLVLAAH